jgi:iron-sulfur cluster assembly protein
MSTVIANETNAPVTFTESAAIELRKLLTDAVDPLQNKLRVGVKGGGCSGMTYVLGIDKHEEDDREYEIAGIPVVMKKAHELYLSGISIDWQNGLNNRGFTFTNPNASSTCGCGTSFSV